VSLRRCLLVVSLVLPLTAVPPATSEPDPGGSRAVVAKVDAVQQGFSPLHATRGANPGIFNARGARVLLHGVNVNGLAEYYAARPDLPTTIPVRRDDFRRIARVGFNSVRLLVSWSRLEPRPGAYNTTYVERVKRAVRQAASFGLYVVIDMHQDAWGPGVFTPEGETCLPGASRANGWDGAPLWATRTDGLPTCRFGARELSPAVAAAWQHFYDNDRGIQTHLVRTWGRLAADFAAMRSVAGFDLLNEPNAGLLPGVADTAALGAFYDSAIRAIRKGESSRPGGFHHIVFFEPGILWSALGIYPTVLPSFTDDTNIVFAPHIYAESISPNSIETGFQNAADVAKLYGVTVWSGEYGFFSSKPDQDADKLDRYGAAEDAHLFGGAWWSWKQACGDPHVTHEPGGQPDPVSPSLVRYGCPGDHAAARIAPAYREVLSRPMLRAVPGRVTRFVSNGRQGTLTLAGVHTRGADRCGLRIFVPQRWAQHQIRTTGIRGLHSTTSLGNVDFRGCVDDLFTFRLLRETPRRDGLGRN